MLSGRNAGIGLSDHRRPIVDGVSRDIAGHEYLPAEGLQQLVRTLAIEASPAAIHRISEKKLVHAHRHHDPLFENSD